MIRTLFQHFVRTKLWGMDVHPSARIASSALIDRTFPRGVHIEENVVIDEEVVVLTHDMVRGLYVHTRICAGTVVGPRAIVMPGISIGRDCVVAAGAVVNRDVPDATTVIGNPARPIADGESIGGVCEAA